MMIIDKISVQIYNYVWHNDNVWMLIVMLYFVPSSSEFYASSAQAPWIAAKLCKADQKISA